MRMPAFPAELILAGIGIAVEAHSFSSKPIDRFPRALSDEADRNRIAQSCPGIHGVCYMRLEAIRGIEHRGDSALGLSSAAACCRGLGDNSDLQLRI